MTHRLFIICCGFLALWAMPAHGVNPETLRYQATLADDAGVPLSTTVALTFKIFDDVSAGTELWFETLNGIDLSETAGRIDKTLGLLTPIESSVFDGPNRWLEVAVNGVPLTPRQQLAAVPYAHSAERLGDAVVTDDATGDVSIGGVVSIGPTLTIDNVGDLSFAATPVANRLYPDSMVKAWSDTQSDAGINDSFNVTITRPSTGVYKYTFRRPMANNEYAVTATASSGASPRFAQQWTGSGCTKTANSFCIKIYSNDGAAANNSHSVIVIGDQ